MANRPLYAQTSDSLRSRIGKAWRLGDRLPAEPALCEEFGVSSITMRRAVATLVAEGLVVRRQGRGTYVSDDHSIVQGPPRLTSFSEDLAMRGWESEAKVLSVSSDRGRPEICMRLGLNDGARITRIERLRLANGKPVAIQVASLPSLLFPGLESHDFSRESLYEVMRAEYEARPSDALETYRASAVTAEEALLLDVPEGSAAFRAERLTQDSSGRRIEFVESVIRGDRYTLHLKLAASRQPQP